MFNKIVQQLVEIDSVYDDRFNTTPPILHWTAGLNEEQTMMMTVTDTVFSGGMLIYSWEGNLSQTENNAGDTTYYWITVEDGSAAHNEAFSEIKYFITGQKQIIGHWDILDPFSNLSDIANWTPFNEVMIQEGFGWDQFLIENISPSEGDYDEMTFYVKKNDKNYKIYSMKGMKSYPNKLKQCLKKKKEIVKIIEDILEFKEITQYYGKLDSKFKYFFKEKNENIIYLVINTKFEEFE